MGTTTERALPRKGDAERRAFAATDFRVGEGVGTIGGHPIVVSQRANVASMFDEVFEPGCFDGCDFRDVLFSANVNHDLQTVPLARSRNNTANSTLQLQVDAVGLACRARLDLENNFHARALHSAVGREDVGGMSALFVVGEDRWEGLGTEMPLRHITAVARVIEITAASMPVFPGTDINARDDQSALESAARVLESARSRLESQENERRAIRELKDALRGRKAGH